MHEASDPYAEGWDAHAAGMGRESNPYLLIAASLNEARQTVVSKRARRRDVELWLRGWMDRQEEIEENGE